MREKKHNVMDADSQSTPTLIFGLNDATTETHLAAILSADSRESGFTNAPERVCLSLVHEGRLVGGLSGHVNWDWLSIELLAVDVKWRSHGLGKQLVLAAEKLARKRNCTGVRVDTHSFQTPEFYARLGYEELGRLPNYPPGHSRIVFHRVI